MRGCGGDGGDGGSRFSKGDGGSRSKKNIEDVVKQRVQGLRSSWFIRERVLDGAFGGVGDEEVVVGEGLEEEALVEFMVELFEEDKDGKKNEKDVLFNLKANDQSRKS
ncbi:hypothetical protein Tco_1453101 [Tanacetum coccineum]